MIAVDVTVRTAVFEGVTVYRLVLIPEPTAEPPATGPRVPLETVTVF